MQFLYQKLGKSNEAFGRNWQKWSFLGQNGQILTKKTKTGLLGENPKMSLSILYDYLTSCTKSENSYWWMLRSRTDEHTRGRTHEHTHGRMWIRRSHFRLHYRYRKVRKRYWCFRTFAAPFPHLCRTFAVPFPHLCRTFFRTISWVGPHLFWVG